MNLLPQELLDSLNGLPGYDEESFRQVHESVMPMTSVRINPAKNLDIGAHFHGAEKIPWASCGYYLPQRPSFTTDPLFHAGAYYVQEAGSMFLEAIFRQKIDLSRPLKVLDLCASPGGKSTHIQSLISDDSLLVSNEVIKSRVNTLAENLGKWGSANVIVTNNDAKHFQRLPSFFDVLFIDAPCSGSGLFRKSNDAIKEWSTGNVALCCGRQARILEDALPCLRPGGWLIYSTCSYSKAENEDIADVIAAKHGLKSQQINTALFPGITETISAAHRSFGYRFYPDKIRAEGFYITAFQKPGDEATITSVPKDFLFESVSGREESVLRRYFNSDALKFLKQDSEILAFPRTLIPALATIKKSLYIRKAGTKAGGLIRDELIPDHDLAMSPYISDIFPAIDLPLPAALDYLRKKEIDAQALKKGWHLAKYKDHALGFLKILPGRTNNYYPKELRILNR